MSMVNGALSSTKLIISKSSSVEVPLIVIGIRESLPHRFTSFPLNKLVPPREGIMEGFPIASQVLYGIMFTCVYFSRIQSMSKSPILASTCSLSLKISGNQTYLCSFRVSVIRINIFFDSCWVSSIILVLWSPLGFSCSIFSFSSLAIILGKFDTSWSVALQQRQLGFLPRHSLAICPGLL
jgi:hypothetical protein